MQICVLSSVAESGDDPYAQSCDPNLSRFLPGHDCEYRFVHKPSAAAEVAELGQRASTFLSTCATARLTSASRVSKWLKRSNNSGCHSLGQTPPSMAHLASAPNRFARS
jgi:hypothetical protein